MVFYVPYFYAVMIIQCSLKGPPSVKGQQMQNWQAESGFEAALTAPKSCDVDHWTVLG